MKNVNKNSISLTLKVISVLAFGSMFIPFSQAAAAPTYVYGHYNADGSYTYGDFVWNNSTSNTNGTNGNPVPAINSISPKSAAVNAGAKTITVTGEGFIPGSVVRVNDSARATTFIDPSHLLVQIDGNDTYTYENNGGFFITVFNKAPGGGYSNALFFTVTSASTANENSTDKNSGSDLAANAIFGSGGFLPSGLIEWVILAIIIMIIVIIARKAFGASKSYHEAPLKHA